jgi:hypothetical protein|tara:strand:+ start:2558 stop:2665 length:108 start_codon:yes stop_codon:yes gene_type:complete
MSHQQTENGGNHADIAGSEEEEPEWELGTIIHCIP